MSDVKFTIPRSNLEQLLYEVVDGYRELRRLGQPDADARIGAVMELMEQLDREHAEGQ